MLKHFRAAEVAGAVAKAIVRAPAGGVLTEAATSDVHAAGVPVLGNLAGFKLAVSPDETYRVILERVER